MPHKSLQSELTVGEVAARSGLAVSAIRFYEEQGLIRSRRTAGNQRRYGRHVLRRLAVIKIAQRTGIPLAEIREALRTLPQERAPDAEDWRHLSAVWREELEQRIRHLMQLRDQLDDCIGCGCLSLEVCPLRNPGDALGDEGSGPRLLEPDN